MDKIYTTFEISKICNVEITTVIAWINKHKIRAHVTPGGHRRVREADLLKFLQQYNFPLPQNLRIFKKILVVWDHPKIASKLLAELKKILGEHCKTEWAEDGVKALLQLGSHPYDLLIFNMNMPGVDGAQVLKALRSNPKLNKIKIIAMVNHQLSQRELKTLQPLSVAFYPKPYDIDQIVQKAKDLLLISDRVTEKVS